jgi:hypothetical protein
MVMVQDTTANAKLIVAAPKLLEQLKSLVEWCEDNYLGRDCEPLNLTEAHRVTFEA